MKKTIFSKAIAILGSIAMLVGVAACGQSNDSTKTATDGNDLTKVTFMLSWAPDTNHIGVYVAKNKGYFKQAGLDVDIVAVAQAGAEQAVNNGMADFALSNLTNVGIYTLKGAKIKQVMQALPLVTSPRTRIRHFTSHLYKLILQLACNSLRKHTTIFVTTSALR